MLTFISYPEDMGMCRIPGAVFEASFWVSKNTEEDLTVLTRVRFSFSESIRRGRFFRIDSSRSKGVNPHADGAASILSAQWIQYIERRLACVCLESRGRQASFVAASHEPAWQSQIGAKKSAFSFRTACHGTMLRLHSNERSLGRSGELIRVKIK
jgi:hypothetical protein